ncbi:MAG: hypothetical protein HFJ80_04230 [Clostridiales bacterium]|nr:hypothetical protein [Clostridiales bacterium]
MGTAERRAGKGESYHIRVGDGTWIGTRATLLNNTVVGDACVIAACACVNKNVEAGTLAGGVPARTIRKLTE